MAQSARGTVEATVAGKTRRLRVSLDAIQRFESKKGNPNFLLVLELWVRKDTRTLTISVILDLFVEFCRAGGTPLTEEEREELHLGDLMDVSEAIGKAFEDGELVKPAQPAKSGGPPQPAEKKRKSPPRKKSPGGSGRR
jgi:hypothetical protein